MKLSFVLPQNSFLEELIKPLEKMGHTIQVNELSIDTDLMIVWSISVMNIAQALRKKVPKIPMVNYNWDVYEWTRTHPRGYDWHGYGRFMSKSLEVWTPSEGVNMRMDEYYGLRNYYIIKTFARFFEAPVEVEDKRFVINVMRDQPDRNVGWFEKAVKELDIPSFSPNHNWSEKEFQEKLATCSFLVCPYYEASTGGLTLLEAHRLGKPVLVSNSPYMGAIDYFGNRANYFQFDDYEDFKTQLKTMWDNTPQPDIIESRKFTEQFTPQVMAEAIDKRIKEIL